MSFKQAMVLLIDVEGEYIDDPRDPGRATKYGISSRSYPHLDIRNLSLEQATAIYHADYWLLAHCDKLKPPLSFLVFDSAVNNGVETAIGLLQTAAGTAPDGMLGPITMRAIAAMAPDILVLEYLARRIVYMAGLANWDRNALGWTRRLLSLVAGAATMKPDC